MEPIPSAQGIVTDDLVLHLPAPTPPPRRQFTAEYRQECVAKALARPTERVQLARELGLAYSTLTSWVVDYKRQGAKKKKRVKHKIPTQQTHYANTEPAPYEWFSTDSPEQEIRQLKAENLKLRQYIAATFDFFCPKP